MPILDFNAGKTPGGAVQGLRDLDDRNYALSQRPMQEEAARADIDYKKSVTEHNQVESERTRQVIEQFKKTAPYDVVMKELESKIGRLQMNAMDKNPELFLGAIAAEKQKTIDDVSYERIGRENAMTWTGLGSLLDGFDAGQDNQSLTQGYQMFSEQYQKQTGRSFAEDYGIDPKQGVNAETIKKLRRVHKMVGYAAEYAHKQKVELEQIKTAPYTAYFQSMKESRSQEDQDLQVANVARKNINASMSGMFPSFDLASDGTLLQEGNPMYQQYNALEQEATNLFMSFRANPKLNVSEKQIADMFGQTFMTKADYDLPGLAWDDEVNVIVPRDPAGKKAWLEELSKYVKRGKKDNPDMSSQALADEFVRLGLRQFSNRVGNTQ